MRITAALCFACAIACGKGTPPPVAPEPAPVEPAPEPEPEPEPDPLASRCVDDMAPERPVRAENAGEGEKYLRVENSTESELRARVISGEDMSVVDGTLVIPAKGEAKYWLDAGEYKLRIREERGCRVLIGDPFVIREEVRGVAITIAFKYGPDGAPLGMDPAEGGL